MNKQILSQLLDGELETDEMEEALDDLLADPELQQAWMAQYTVRAAIRDSGVHTPLNMVDRVSAALENEPTIMAPDNLVAKKIKGSDEDTSESNVVPFAARRNKTLAYVAIAASFAALVTVIYLPKESSSPNIAESDRTTPTSIAVEQELQSMIVQHGEFSGAAALNGLVAYAKVVDGSIGSESR